MEQIPSDEEVCAASLADRDSVVAIADDVYSGLDNLPDTYPSLVEGPGVRGYLYKKGGRTVGFMTTELTDGGRTLVMDAARIVKEYRGRGMYGRFQRLVLRQYIRSHDIWYLAFTVDNTNMAVNGQRLLRTYRNVSEKTVTCVELTSSDFNFHGKTESDNPRMRILSSDDMTSIMSSESLDDLLHLFPDRRMILDWKPYRAMPENVPIITNTCTHRVFVATDAESSSPLNRARSSLPRILSAGSYYRCKIGTCYSADVFGDGSEDELRAHITWHILRSANVGNGNVAITVSCTRSLDEMMADLGKTFPLRKSNLPFKQVISFEQVLKSSCL
ncbi:histidine N-acetyltransferase-like isoform X2 [Pomacea canaliculata]|uniref:histidine N-acetyltransferase-like isoform X2 n=1 Tax=Pomacea canaliculata TaxID=400727 RepID=UPI000D733412|nr:histidine N-acetyltransferase-like isoform X2 [Pomacea canaliculata]XP_025087079.1 histidine N-acetyltransferase-like isoform X2 [Pomacea canaliculata]